MPKYTDVPSSPIGAGRLILRLQTSLLAQRHEQLKDGTGMERIKLGRSRSSKAEAQIVDPADGIVEGAEGDTRTPRTVVP